MLLRMEEKFFVTVLFGKNEKMMMRLYPSFNHHREVSSYLLQIFRKSFDLLHAGDDGNGGGGGQSRNCRTLLACRQMHVRPSSTL